MKLSKKTDYALRALLTLAERWGNGVISIRELAQKNDVPKRFLEQIMLAIKEQGWVKGTPGREGGYQLAVNPKELTLGQVVRFFDGVVAPVSCVSVTQYEPCSQEALCRFRRVLLDVRNYTAQRLDYISLFELLGTAPVSEQERLNLGFLDGAGI
ncbi:MAG: Rrf2 family transcriptional regulator [Candidatus Lambdaproteobacteria bacterium RIFOXYD1_FULL_56_27]|uniref:Rrf2 family transcriptional regulator n=1 Tax=Candidatus Lambdaproteobacteria bacterium RIFOXYD2_FULL_56_26 TaxID=1817773 RepID=A0A1F6GR99_9PROT|nr:MAG: Rrf2 family transcriptional regulator [Candidatus Lambdaproteobacteria bacterium RIFOXYC1_FULL_56_13]OGH00706.1 MAG: Rrf2 family transcriptional regulator [Candidatus Lambdaproteobacteria bacterium RIFOXYD2_FULL_56_26]OGH07873.1 MAG: Rrf2 family transcriptional regulator [Candidatus Lambdaproteobacteria bacterium RIFOXYD1_FULL_56_27]